MIQQEELAQLVKDYIESANSDFDKEQGKRVLALVESSPDFWRRSHFDPGHVTVSAFAVNKKKDAAVFLNHRKHGRWQQLGGHLEEEDENIFQAMLRELEEEGGLRDVHVEEKIFDVDVFDVAERGEEPGHQHFDVRVLAHATGDETLCSQEEIPQEVRWIPFADIKDYTDEESILQMIEKYQSRL